MKLLKKVIGPKSKYDKSIPFAYMAKVYKVEGEEELCRYFYGDTICRLIQYLDEHNILPSEVNLYGLFRNEEILIEKEACTDKGGKWLLKPDLCRSLENQYNRTLDKIYKGHIEIGECEFEDREEVII